MLEDIVARLHEHAGVTVSTRIKVPVVGNPKRSREIDVLLSSYIAGYPARVAIECKNEEAPVGAPRIDEFIGKLGDIGIPTNFGVFVSPVGYTKDGFERAAKAGVRTLLLGGLTPDRLGIEIGKAFQSCIYVMATWRKMNSFPYLPAVATKGPGINVMLDRERHGDGKLGLLNVLWELWIRRAIPDSLGEHTVSIQLPKGFTLNADDGAQDGGVVIVEMKVAAHVATFEGTAKDLRLRNADTKAVEKRHIEMRYDCPQGSIPLTCFETEEELSSHLQHSGLHVSLRIRVPRIRDEKIYWPPTEEAIRRIEMLRASGQEISFANVEGLDLIRAWEIFSQTEKT